MSTTLIEGLYVPVEGSAALVRVEYDGSTYEHIAKLIGAELVEFVRTPLAGVSLIVDEEGLLKGRRPNRVSYRMHPGMIVGDVLVLGVDDTDPAEGIDIASLEGELLDIVIDWIGHRSLLGTGS